MLADDLKEIRSLADEIYVDLDLAWEDTEDKARLQGILEEVVSLMDEALEALSEM